MYRIIANKRIVKLLASGPQAESWFSAFQRWFRIKNRASFGEFLANYIKSVWILTNLAVTLSKMVWFSIRNHRWKAQNKPYQLTKAWGALIRAGALNGDNKVYVNYTKISYV